MFPSPLLVSSTVVHMYLVSLLRPAVGDTHVIAYYPSVFDGWREKRQTHEETTFARIPEIPFSFGLQISSGSAELLGRKRQTHPDATIARIPEVPFSDAGLQNPSGPADFFGSGPANRPDLESNVPTPVEYLTPPPPPASVDDSGVAAAGFESKAAPADPNGKWDLGWNANDVLVPPADQEQYDTLKLFTLVPNSAGPLPDESSQSDTDNGPQQGLLSLQDSTGEGSDQDEYREDNDRRVVEEKSPVFTYVKTDKQGHFKWGVRHGN